MGLTTSKRLLSWYDYTFVWCDDTFDEANLPSNRISVKNLTSCEECETYFQSLNTTQSKKTPPVLLVVHESFSKEVIPRIYSFSKLFAIYIFDPNENFDERWFSSYEKVKGVGTTIAQLIEKIEMNHQNSNVEPIPLSLFDEKLLHRHCTRNLLNEIIHLPYLINRLYQNTESSMSSSSDRMHDLINFCRDEYRDNPYELRRIRSFEQTYSSKRVLRWFLKESFLMRLFHRVLQRQDLHQLRFFHFFINDLEQQLKRMSFTSAIRVYKGQWMSKEQWNQLENAHGEFCSIDDFWLTELEKKRACRVLDQSRHTLIPVLFKIDADPRFESSLPFANIHSWTKNNDNVVLFMIGSIFQIIDTYEQDDFFIVKLKLCCQHHEQLNVLTDEDVMRSFGHVLLTLGRFQQAEIFYENLMNKFPTKMSIRLHSYQKLALIYDEYGDYPKSLDYFHQILHRYSKDTNSQKFDLGSIYVSLGDVYRKHGDFTEAFEYFNRAIDYWERQTDGYHAFELAICYNNLGIVYEEEDDYDQALVYYLKAYDLRSKYCSYDQISLGISMTNLGGVYTHLGQPNQAFNAYQQALNIYRSSLPDRHPKIALTLNNLGGLYEHQGELEKATECYEKARDIYRSIFRCENANLLKIEMNLDRIKTKSVSPVVQF